MAQYREIRASYDAQSVVVYQAYPPRVAEPALEAQRFVSPFSFQRMTWIKPSFLWMMHRSNWGRKVGQERILAVRIRRSGWEKALSLAVPTTPSASGSLFRNDGESAMTGAQVLVQWDPERNLRGGALEHRSIQVGIGRSLIREYATEWVLSIEDCTPAVRKMHEQLRRGEADLAERRLPKERPYPVLALIGRPLGIAEAAR